MGTRHFTVATEAEVSARVRIGGGGPPAFDSADFGDDSGSRRWRVPNRTYQTGTWLFIAAITMMFAGLTSTIVVRQSAATDWGHVSVPSILYLNTLVLLLSSATFEFARRSANRAEANQSSSLILYGTLALGLLFVGGQLIAWRTLVERGVYLASNPSSSTFYLLTAIHALHLIGGVLVLAYLVSRMDAMKRAKFRACLGAASLYWHFMSALWLYILLILVTRT
jgi:cytochrome c oxidase subunit 3